MTTPQPIIQTRIPIAPRSVKGRYRSIKTAILIFAYTTYFSLPWLPWQRTYGPDQTILFDIVNRRFYLFDLVIYAQDIFWLAGFLIIAALLLFFVTGIAGRVFCGYFCFQTLWTDVFIWIERLVQGERNVRLRLACAPWSPHKALRIGATWLLWLAVAFWTGFSFTLYWSDASSLFIDFFTGQAPFPAYATTLFLTASTFVMAGIAREQVCTYMCPYARFQAVMFDEATLVVAYDKQRGEGRLGRHKPDKAMLTAPQRHAAGYGDCVDCGYCVQVCPTGIDIRDGLQYQCISCALCIDACNSIMDAAGFQRGLVRYSAANTTGKSFRVNLKNTAYGVVLLGAIIGLIWMVLSREPVELFVEQVRQPLHVLLSDGRVQNHYILKVNNKTSQPVRYIVSLQGLEADWTARPDRVLSIAPEGTTLVDVYVRMPVSEHTHAAQNFAYVINGLDAMDAVSVRHEARFFWPVRSE